MPAFGPYEDDDADLEITHAAGELTTLDYVSTFPGVDGGDGQPKVVEVRKPLP